MDLSIIIVSFNCKKYLRRCLQSIKNYAQDLSFEISVIDNASSDHTVSELKTEFESVHWIENKVNHGFAKANNQGLRLAKGRYCLILNPDTEIFPETLQKAILFMDNHLKVGAVSMKTWSDPDKTLHWIGDRELTFDLLFLQFTFLGKLPKYMKILKKEWQRDWALSKALDPFPLKVVDGHALFFRREILDQVGYLDENFFMYFEDIDFSYRIRQAGWQLFYLPQAEIVHYAWKSSLSGAPVANYFFNSLKFFLKKHYSIYRRLSLHIAIIFSLLFNKYFSFLKRKLRACVQIKSSAKNHKILTRKDPQITWQSEPNAKKYLLEMSNMDNFLNKGLRYTEEPKFIMPDIYFDEWQPKEKFFYRVAAVFEDGSLSKFQYGSFEKGSN